jgi:UDP-2-acetamido-3-amino-2,3-dideoxy-glucuronate N-acetyltransferase
MKKYFFKKYTKKSGSLIPFSLINDIPFKTKRIFIIYGNKNFVRGNHAHYKCKQFLVPIFGSMKIEYENKKGKFEINIDFKKKRGILLEPKTWCRIKFNTKKCILMVFCDREYEFSDYIENYKDFLKLI